MMTFFVAGARRLKTEQVLRRLGGVVLRSEGDKVQLDLSAIEVSDVAVFAHNWTTDPLARVQHEYCALISKPVMYEGLDGLS